MRPNAVSYKVIGAAMNVVRVRTAEGKTRTVRLSQIQKGADSN